MRRIRAIFDGLRLFGPLRLKIDPNSITVATSVVGLGNRLMAFASAYGLAAEFSISKVNLIWIADRYVAYCKFSDLFELTTNDTEVVLDREIGYSLLAFYLGIYGKALFNFSGLQYMLLAGVRQLGHRLAQRSFDQIYHFLDMLTKAEIKEHHWRPAARFRRLTPKLGDRTLVYSHELFHGEPCFDFCRPRPHLQKRVDEIADQFGEYTVGVHIRMVDHMTGFIKLLDKNSPMEMFIQRMTAELEKNDRVKFFLATDSSYAKELLTEHFKGRVMTQESTFVRTEHSGMENAVVDMFTLARTDKILAPYISTFSRCAAMVGKTEFEVVLKTPILNQVYKENLAPALRVFEDEQSC